MTRDVDWVVLRPASDDDFGEIEKYLEKDIPESYRRFIKKNGFGGGFVGGKHIILWTPEEMKDLNDAYEVEKNCPGILLFGGNGGGTGFAFIGVGETVRFAAVELISLSPGDLIDLGQEFEAVLSF